MTWDKTTKTLLLALILILGVSLIRPPTLHKGIPAKVMWARKVLWPTQFDIVLAGDSRTYHGLSPHTMQTLLNHAAIGNFGFSSTALAGEYLDAVENLLNPESAQPTIVLGVSPLSLTPHSAKVSEFLEYQRKRKIELYELAYLGPFLNPFAAIDIQHILNLFRSVHPGHHHVYYENGWVAAQQIPEDPAKGLWIYNGIVDKRGSDGTVSEAMIQSLLLRIQQWRKQGIRVYGFRPPATDDMKHLEHTRMGFNEEAFVRRFENAGGIWLAPTGSYHSDDGSHLHQDSALRFSADLARLMAETRFED